MSARKATHRPKAQALKPLTRKERRAAAKQLGKTVRELVGKGVRDSFNRFIELAAREPRYPRSTLTLLRMYRDAMREQHEWLERQWGGL